jgi:hypothetical protein
VLLFSWVGCQLSKKASIDEGRWSFLVISSDMEERGDHSQRSKNHHIYFKKGI